MSQASPLRANGSPAPSSPDGDGQDASVTAKGKKKSALERHAAFFDPEGTGFVDMKQTWRGLASLGIPAHYNVLLTPIINGFLGHLTQGKPGVIKVSSITEGKHPYDTGVFADDGSIDREAFGDLLLAASGDKLTAKEMKALIVGRGNRRKKMGAVAGFLGRWFSFREVQLLFCLGADTTKREDGNDVPAISRKNLERFYEGSLLPALARKRRIEESRRARRG